jgi:hypothetical protein
MNAQDQRRFDEIRHRLALVMSGPHTADGVLVVALRGTPEEFLVADCQVGPFSLAQDRANAAFFAHAWDDITWLTERVRDLERALKGQGHERA